MTPTTHIPPPATEAGPLDAKTIADALRVLVPAGEPLEIRALGITGRTRVVSGYYTDLDRATTAIVRLDSQYKPGGVYWTINTLVDGVEARSPERMTPDPKTTTSDKDIARRRYIAIDVDPVRPADISATDEQVKLAIHMQRIVVEFCCETTAFPPPITYASGNGGAILFRCDLPNEEQITEGIKTIYKGLSKLFDSDVVKIDQGIFNPGRIMKVPGTMARKGANTTNRPWRRAYMIDQPDSVPMTRAHFDDAVKWFAKIGGPDKKHEGNGRTPLDVPKWCAEHGLTIKSQSPWAGGERFILEQCPFDSNHGGTSVAILQHSSGATVFKCFHDSCSNRNWADLRAHVGDVRGAGSAATSDDEWETPTPLGDFDLPEFPLDALPDDLSEYVEAVAESFQVPVDMPGLLLFGVFATALAPKVKVSVRGDWSEPVNLWLAAVMDSGDRKSPVLRELGRPLIDHEKKLAEESVPSIAAAKSDRDILERQIKSERAKAAKHDDEGAKQRARDLQADLDGLPEITTPRILSDDVTQERLVGILQQNGGCASIMSSEGGVFEVMRGRYAKNGAPNIDVYLKAYSGDPIRVDRVGRASEHVENPALTMALTVQPNVLQGLLSEPTLRGRGLLARWLYTLPKSNVGYRSVTPAKVPVNLRAGYELAVLKCLEIGGDLNAIVERQELKLSAEGWRELEPFAAEVEAAMRTDGELRHLKDWALKLPGQVCRVAGVLHCMTHTGGPKLISTSIGGGTMRKAVLLGRYLIEHAKAAFAEMGADAASTLARDLSRWLQVSGVEEFSRRDAYKRLHVREAEIDGPLRVLEENAHVKPVTVKGRRTGLFRVNPNLSPLSLSP